MIDPQDEQVLRLELTKCSLAGLIPESEVPVDSKGRNLLAVVLVLSTRQIVTE